MLQRVSKEYVVTTESGDMLRKVQERLISQLLDYLQGSPIQEELPDDPDRLFKFLVKKFALEVAREKRCESEEGSNRTQQQPEGRGGTYGHFWGFR